ncbi:ImmA/IrrE family metallo-endopeptidase [Pseudoclavibacter helvolus]|uniref:Zn-dependent peptidase ImmA (M78 family) n=1 Tax=Pseudoclavibacter helvolus TaxID=255205 RepID=A0A7W4UMQ5_9MICO|nr:ImmA/IrrE family metallo-endopeptidase [Pseudoclavibacter helvolus]MBB2957292.1 Zn-dependent peptidase ImmA (M78 family) [Pseudoclavibacter helvolus]
MYDPYEHAQKLGLKIEEARIRTANALLIPEKNLILVRPKLPAVHRRATIAHEIVHFEKMDVGRAPWQEDRADRIAAKRLILPADVLRAERMYEHPELIARELGVPTKYLHAWRQAA